ncbi:hypothetical protein PISMIDRAFT_688999 [Pisolithus microcarpus 441]|uniref:Uncharacterized protein n=1 Tax=Pisolithus microcarpus 441 TaxID=765257 RepID=A0A0C9YS00_9AGAM|nr:hypothetical protein PISMIDRAFT_688999 [Pisolithus microcarpus 441]
MHWKFRRAEAQQSIRSTKCRGLATLDLSTNTWNSRLLAANDIMFTHAPVDVHVVNERIPCQLADY